MRLLGLTGGIASGKSLAADYFRALGVPVIDTDDLARQVVAPGQPAWRRLRELFPPACFRPDGELDRAAVARCVFANPAARARLEAITHPAIFAAVDAAVARLRAAPHPPPLAVVVVPLLFEVGAEGRFDATVLVDADPAQQRARLIAHRGYTPQEAEARMAAQLPPEEKRRRADHCLANTGAPDALRAQVAALVARLTGGAAPAGA